jgi:hypothetical protein
VNRSIAEHPIRIPRSPTTVTEPSSTQLGAGNGGDRSRRHWLSHHRRALLWMLAAFVSWQAVLSIIVDRGPTEIRDPEYGLLERLLQDRRAEKPNRPTCVFLGSSRIAEGFDAEHSSGQLDATVFNFGIVGCGPFFQNVVLDRLAKSNILPDVAFEWANTSLDIRARDAFLPA